MTEALGSDGQVRSVRHQGIVCQHLTVLMSVVRVEHHRGMVLALEAAAPVIQVAARVARGILWL